ncbi:MAG: hypothetical protein WC335_07185 [Candidatus Omnitrophota bacterium]
MDEADESSHGFSLHLLHDPATVDFDRLKGGSPFSGNLLTQHTLGYEPKNLQIEISSSTI